MSKQPQESKPDYKDDVEARWFLPNGWEISIERAAWDFEVWAPEGDGQTVLMASARTFREALAKAGTR